MSDEPNIHVLRSDRAMSLLNAVHAGKPTRQDCHPSSRHAILFSSTPPECPPQGPSTDLTSNIPTALSRAKFLRDPHQQWTATSDQPRSSPSARSLSGAKKRMSERRFCHKRTSVPPLRNDLDWSLLLHRLGDQFNRPQPRLMVVDVGNDHHLVDARFGNERIQPRAHALGGPDNRTRQHAHGLRLFKG